MQDVIFTDDFCRFIQSTIPSVEAAEILLFLQKTPDSTWAVKEITEGLRESIHMSEGDAAKCVDLLQARSLVSIGPDRRVKYHPATAEIDAHARTLAQAYLQRPVTLIRMIYALRDGRIQSFADAFKFMKS